MSACRIKDKAGCVPAEYLHVESSETDRAIQRIIAIAIAELTVGPKDTDLAHDDDDVASEGSGSSSD